MALGISIEFDSFLNWSIGHKAGTLTGTTTPGQSQPTNEGVLQIFWNGASLSDAVSKGEETFLGVPHGVVEEWVPIMSWLSYCSVIL